ncbi:MAG: hypothetical protein U0414_14020 [Polyangiaceae bacterium]
MTEKKLEGEDAEMAAFSEALAAAMRPSDIDPDRHEEILARVLGGALLDETSPRASSAEQVDEAPADEAEQRRSSLLAAYLDGRVESSDPGLVRLAQLARALRLAYAPTSIDELTHQRVLAAGLKTATRTAARRTVAGAVFVLVAAAAAIVGLYVQRRGVDPSTASRATRAPLIEARSSQELFDPMKPFDREKGTTERVDKITTTRDAELRDNRFNAWGVQ